MDLGDFYPQIKVDRLGNSYVAWQGFDGNDWEIYWVKIDASQICGQVQKVSNYLGSTGRFDLYPQIAIDASGNSYITWVSSDCHFDQCEIEIYWAKIGAAGKPERVQKISYYPNSLHFNLNPRIAVNIDGNSYITWAGKDALRDDHIFFTALLPSRGLALKEIIEMIVITVVIVIIAIVILRKKPYLISEKK
ncbi:MAG: hypothetical protein HXS44_13805 [Theionarchaea archaeon]|nr:hypothetical protein [Theionarchaea archaeon]